jgi:hypothetical protein
MTSTNNLDASDPFFPMTIPVIRKIVPQTIAASIVNVQPISTPTSNIFTLRRSSFDGYLLNVWIVLHVMINMFASRRRHLCNNPDESTGAEDVAIKKLLTARRAIISITDDRSRLVFPRTSLNEWEPDRAMVELENAIDNLRHIHQPNDEMDDQVKQAIECLYNVLTDVHMIVDRIDHP